jgi:hypothetical protein
MNTKIIRIIQVFIWIGAFMLIKPGNILAQEIIEEDSSSSSTQYEVIEENPAIAPVPYKATEPPVPYAEPIQSGRKKRGGAVITGAVLFGVSYGIGLYCIAFGAPATIVIPVAGPAIAILSDSYVPETIIPLAIGWSAAQGIGLGLLIRGLIGDPIQTATNNHLNIEPLALYKGMGLRLRLNL